MKGKYYTIQIIPEDSKEIKKYRISTKWSLVLKIILVLLIISSGVLIYNAGRIGKIVVQYEKMRTANAQLAKQNANYEELFSRIDSLWVLEERIQNILGTFIENDSNKINSLIDKNRFAHTPSEKINVDYEGIHGWKSMEEKSRLEHIPNVIPVVGIVSKKFSEENDHLGTDFSAQSGDPVFASGSGIVEFAGQKDELGNTVVIDHQNAHIARVQLAYMRLESFVVRLVQRDGHLERSALPFSAFHLNVAVHELHDVLRDWHAEPSATVFAGRR